MLRHESEEEDELSTLKLSSGFDLAFVEIDLGGFLLHVGFTPSGHSIDPTKQSNPGQSTQLK